MQHVPNIEDLIEDYARLEQRIHSAIRKRSAAYCARCKTPCCKDEHCLDVEESPWLRLVAERTSERRLDALTQTGPARFLGPNGCLLKAGRPMQCTWYICDDLCLAIRDPLDRFVYQVTSNLLGHVARGVSRDHDLVDFDDLDDLTPARRKKVRTRIREARTCLDIVLSLQAERDAEKPVNAITAKVLYVCRILPFVARTVRFDGETPSLSAAGHTRTAQSEPKSGK